jgi:hypothetical protein
MEREIRIGWEFIEPLNNERFFELDKHGLEAKCQRFGLPQKGVYRYYNMTD